MAGLSIMRFRVFCLFCVFVLFGNIQVSRAAQSGLLLDVYDTSHGPVWRVSVTPDVIRVPGWNWMPVAPSALDSSDVRDWSWSDDPDAVCPEDCRVFSDFLGRYGVEKGLVRRHAENGGLQIILFGKGGLIDRAVFESGEGYLDWLSQNAGEERPIVRDDAVQVSPPRDDGAETVVLSPGYVQE